VHSFRSNPPSRQIAPRPELLPSASGMRRLRENDPLTMIEWLLAETGMAPSALGRMIAKDSRLVFDLRSGRVPRPAIISAIAKLHGMVRQHREARHA
jgi:hypothetical protein